MSFHQNHITAVREFMQSFGQEVPFPKSYVKEPPPLEVRRLRAKLILEEALEAVRALGVLPYTNAAGEILIERTYYTVDMEYDYNFIECLDALCDLDYVGPSGTAVALGISEELYEKAFALVHESNMRKLWTEEEITNIDLSKYKISEVVKGEESRWLVKDKQGKVIKSPSWVKPNLEGLLDA